MGGCTEERYAVILLPLCPASLITTGQEKNLKSTCPVGKASKFPFSLVPTYILLTQRKQKAASSIVLRYCL